MFKTLLTYQIFLNLIILISPIVMINKATAENQQTPTPPEKQPITAPNVPNNKTPNSSNYPKFQFDLIGNPKVKEQTYKLREGLSKMPPNTPLAIPLGSNKPLISQEVNKNITPSLEAIGLVNKQGKNTPITPEILLLMLDVINIRSEKIKIQSNNPKKPTFHLIVRQRQTGKIYLIKNVHGNIFIRDVFNSFLNGNIRRYFTDSNSPSNSQ